MVISSANVRCKFVARLLGGEVVSSASSAPGPGHSKRDRSMRAFLDPAAPDGFRVQSFADDWRDCRKHVRALLGISGNEYGRRRQNLIEMRQHAVEQDLGREQAEDRAIELWKQGLPVHGTIAAWQIINADKGEALTAKLKAQREAAAAALLPNVTLDLAELSGTKLKFTRRMD